jgi:putative membrane protein
MDSGGWWIGMSFMVLLIALAVVVVLWLVRNQTARVPAPSAAAAGGSAREVLDRRLVAGEITEQEYRRLRAVLSDAPPAGPPVH